MRASPPVSLVWLSVLVLVCRPVPAHAQQLRYRVGLTPRIGMLFGASDLLDSGFGIEATGGLRLGSSPVWIRGDAGFIGLDATTPTPGGQTSDNTLFTFVAGPEIEGHLGAVWPFAHLLVGYALNVPGGDVGTASTNGTGMFGGGAGLRVRLSSSPRPPIIEAGVRLFHAGELSFARVDDAVVTDITAFELRLGLLLGLP